MRVKKCKKFPVDRAQRASLGWWWLACALFVSAILVPQAHAQASNKLTVAAAADLQFALNEIKAGFEEEDGATISVIYGSSGNFFNQIQNGAPYDVFLAADMEYPRKLAASKYADGNTLVRYAIGRLALWVPRESKLDVSKGMNVLLDPGISRIAIANPRHAPYGRAAVEALKAAKLYEKVESKLVLGENAAQAAQFVESGNAQIGLVPMSLVFAPTLKSKGTYYEVPSDTYAAIEQGGVVLSKSENRELARMFLAYLRRPATLQVFKKYGFIAPLSLRKEP